MLGWISLSLAKVCTRDLWYTADRSLYRSQLGCLFFLLFSWWGATAIIYTSVGGLKAVMDRRIATNCYDTVDCRDPYLCAEWVEWRLGRHCGAQSEVQRHRRRNISLTARLTTTGVLLRHSQHGCRRRASIRLNVQLYLAGACEAGPQVAMLAPVISDRCDWQLAIHDLGTIFPGHHQQHPDTNVTRFEMTTIEYLAYFVINVLPIGIGRESLDHLRRQCRL